MRAKRLWTVAALLGLTALVAVTVMVPSRAEGQQAAAKCCFNNPRFTGTCEVTPSEGESCASILAYLNNQAATGKSYCGNTTIRGGWVKVDCK